MAPIGCVPHLHRLAIASRDDARAIGRPRYRCYHIASMPTIGEDIPACRGVPDLHGSISTRRGDTTPIGRPCHREHCGRMTGVGEAMAPIGCVPHLHCLVIAPRSDTC